MSRRIALGRGQRVLRCGPLSLRLELRMLVLCLLLAGAVLAVGLLSLGSGSLEISPATLRAVLSGGGAAQAQMVVLDWRLPRVLLAVLIGAALGLSGAIFQSLTRNPLGSPDVVGFAAGAHCGALVVILLFGGGYGATAAGALAGGLASVLLVYLLAWRQGVEGVRLIVIGIGIAAMLQALNGWMIRAAELPLAMSAALWGAGSLNGLGMEQLRPVALALAVLMPPCFWLAPALRQMELGEDLARATGIRTGRVRLGLMLLGVALTAVATAAAGPVAFIALAAPQIARGLGRAPGFAALASALTGSLLLLVADWLAQHGLGRPLPVGVVTVSIGGFYLLWLLLREGRR